MFYIIFLYVNINENKMRMRTKSFSSNTFELSQDLLRQKNKFSCWNNNTKKYEETQACKHILRTLPLDLYSSKQFSI